MAKKLGQDFLDAHVVDYTVKPPTGDPANSAHAANPTDANDPARHAHPSDPADPTDLARPTH
jgi:hypothetical protein